jgi:hypothetical protein
VRERFCRDPSRRWLSVSPTATNLGGTFVTHPRTNVRPGRGCVGEVRDRVRCVSDRKHIQAIDQILAHPELAGSNADFDAAKTRRKIKHDLAWYATLGSRNFAAVARETGNAALYAILYSGASEVMHSSSDDQHVHFAEGKLMMKRIHSLSGFESVFRFSVSITLALYRKILQEYRPGELQTFSRKYVEVWQKQYMHFLKINYEVAEVITI